jgi:hypothetical protein
LDITFSVSMFQSLILSSIPAVIKYLSSISFRESLIANLLIRVF